MTSQSTPIALQSTPLCGVSAAVPAQSYDLRKLFFFFVCSLRETYLGNCTIKRSNPVLSAVRSNRPIFIVCSARTGHPHLSQGTAEGRDRPRQSLQLTVALEKLCPCPHCTGVHPGSIFRAVNSFCLSFCSLNICTVGFENIFS